MLKSITTIFALLATCLFAEAQQATKIVWEKKYGSSSRSEVAHAIVQNADGGITFAGEWNPGRKTGKDAYLVVLDAAKKAVVEKTFLGRRGDDGAFGIVQTLDGGYALAGYTESAEAPGYQGKRDAWLLKTDENGNALWDQVLGTSGDDEFRGITQDGQGNLILTGSKNGKLWLYKTDWLGKEILDLTLQGKPGKEQGHAIIITRKGGYAITGRRQTDDGWHQIILQTDDGGKQLWRQEYKHARGEAIVQDTEGNFLTAGIMQPKLREQAIVVKYSESGELLWSREDMEGDGAAAILQDIKGDYYAAGYSHSHDRGSHRNDVWLHKLAANGKNEWKEAKYFGDENEDEAKDFLQADDGAIVMAGSTYLSPTDAWVFELQHTTIPGSSTPTRLKFGKVELKDENKNGTLDPGERGWCEFDVINEGDADAWQVLAEVTSEGSHIPGFSYFKKVRIGKIAAGETLRVALPVAGDETLGAGTAQLNVRLASAANSAAAPLKIKVECRKAAAAQLTLASSKFMAGGKPAANMMRGKPMVLEVEIANRGDLAAESVRLKFSFENNIEALSEKLLLIGDLAPGASVRKQFTFQAEEIYQGEKLSIRCRATEKTGLLEVEGEFSIRLEEAPTVTVLEAPREPSFIRISWLYPDVTDSPDASFVSKDSTYEIKVLAFSSSPLNVKDFTLLLNGQPYGEGSKMGETRLDKRTSSSDGAGGGQEYRFQTKVQFAKSGNHQIAVKVVNQAGDAKTTPIKVIYQPDKPNLHILAIGVPYADLLYPSKDAADFVEAMKKQEGKLYGEVFVNLLNTKDTTEATKLRLAFRKLKDDYLYRDKIREKDVVIVFISSHGNNYNQQDYFLLLSSDYNPLYPDETSINYKDNILKPLSDIKCKKYIFIDACHSGAIEGIADSKGESFDGMPEAIESLLKAEAGLHSLVSCKGGELSYEDKTWENGAFTEAILEAFNNIEGKIEKGKMKADQNGDKVVTMGELENYLSNRVPFMVKSLKKVQQTPYMPGEGKGGDDLPLFYYGN